MKLSLKNKNMCNILKFTNNKASCNEDMRGGGETVFEKLPKNSNYEFFLKRSLKYGDNIHFNEDYFVRAKKKVYVTSFGKNEIGFLDNVPIITDDGFNSEQIKVLSLIKRNIFKTLKITK